MKASELRIGDWVYSPTHNDNYKIILLDIDKELNVKPIPLTEEWLFKFGFEKYFYEENGLKLPWYKLHKNDCLFEIDYEFAYTRDDGGYIKLQYVHQLQNLYFALTGEELEMKEVQGGSAN